MKKPMRARQFKSEDEIKRLTNIKKYDTTTRLICVMSCQLTRVFFSNKNIVQKCDIGLNEFIIFEDAQ